ncbi:unnamed protein product [Rhizopus stolonifer]
MRSHEFQTFVSSNIKNSTLTYADNAQYLLALSSILLLKPGRKHTDLHNFINLETCDALRRHLLELFKTEHIMFPMTLKQELEQIVHSVINNNSNGTETSSLLSASGKIMNLLDGYTFNTTNRILLMIR